MPQLAVSGCLARSPTRYITSVRVNFLVFRPKGSPTVLPGMQHVSALTSAFKAVWPYRENP